MPNTFQNLNVPTADGAGAPFDASALGRPKTIVLSGAVLGRYIVEGSNDGGTSWDIIVDDNGQQALFTSQAPGVRNFDCVIALVRVRSVGNAGLAAPPTISLGAHTLQEYFHAARKKLRLPKVNFYQASRHTFASHYVIDGGSIERLSKILGHSSVLVTERYAHLRADHFTAHDLRPMLGFQPERGLRLVAHRSGPAMVGTRGDAAADSDSGPDAGPGAEASEVG